MMVRVAERSNWYVVSSHGAVLFFIAVHPGCTINEIAEGMSLTPRTIWAIVGDLRRAGMLTVQRNGRRHHYTVDLEGPFFHPTLSGIDLRTVLGQVTRGANGARKKTAAPA